MLDNIVTDGMRVAAEVRRRMDEAQKEIDRGGTTRGTEDDDEDEGDGHGEDLLEGAEVDAGSSAKTPTASLLDQPMVEEPGSRASAPPPPTPGASGADVEKSTMFER